jgi:hypothetical protein
LKRSAAKLPSGGLVSSKPSRIVSAGDAHGTAEVAVMKAPAERDAS